MKINSKYKILQGLYWMLFALLGGFCVFYLTGRGLQAHEIGTMTAVFGLLSAVFQYYLARIVDGNEKINFKIVLIIMGVCLMSVFGLLLLKGGKYFAGIVFGVGVFVLNAMLPFINQIAFYYEERNIVADFGSSRGIGSLSFACLSFVLGKLTVNGNIKIIPIFGVVIMIFFIATVCAFPILDTKKEMSKEVYENLSILSFIKKYPSFMFMMAGCVCLMAFHNIGTTYLLPMILNVGGTTENLGVALSMAGILEIPIMLCFRKILKKVEVEKILIVSGVVFTMKAICFYMADGITLIYLAQILQMFSFALNCPATVYYSEKVMEGRDKLTGQALMGMTGILGSVLGAFLGGMILSMKGVKTMTLMGVILAFTGTITVAYSLKHSNSRKN